VLAAAFSSAPLTGPAGPAETRLAEFSLELTTGLLCTCPLCLASQGFDPLGLSGYFSLDYMREAELKHGRICQLACAGYVAVDLGITVPFAPKVSSLAAHDVTVQRGNMLLLLFIIAIPEALSYNAISEMMSGQSDRKPGDYGIPYKFCKPGDTATQEKYKLAEITHCRAAMLGFSGMVTASAATELPFPYF